MKYIVRAQAFHPKSGRNICEPRDEIIDTEQNKLFRNCKTVLQVKMRYEQFWNCLSDNPSALVFVQSVTPWTN
jgi:hypothetical protein